MRRNLTLLHITYMLYACVHDRTDQDRAKHVLKYFEHSNDGKQDRRMVGMGLLVLLLRWVNVSRKRLKNQSGYYFQGIVRPFSLAWVLVAVLRLTCYW